ncbi:hypothetical protein U1Q18_050092, partial [Sarracenia purpurea var. burkii]
YPDSIQVDQSSTRMTPILGKLNVTLRNQNYNSSGEEGSPKPDEKFGGYVAME